MRRSLRRTFFRPEFRNRHNTFAPGPQVLAEKKERLRSSSLFLRRHVLFHVWTTTTRKFCFLPEMWVGACLNVAQGSCHVDSQKNIIETYFLAGFVYDTIVTFLERFHGIHISLSTLKRRLRDYGFKRRNSADLNQKKSNT